ncbi:ESPR-type extended signal peptide-containing protein [Caballeronia sp. Lep1P3]|uniref:ESPR-type extended signal peptide-containing protein n=1 Tax=Caballeronia sp. Lep1P3 TaxID=2878150 RepID=UPI00351D24B4
MNKQSYRLVFSRVRRMLVAVELCASSCAETGCRWFQLILLCGMRREGRSPQRRTLAMQQRARTPFSARPARPCSDNGCLPATFHAFRYTGP